MTDPTVRNRLRTTPDYIAIRRYRFSLKRLEQRYPDGDAPDRVVAAALAVREEDLPAIQAEVVLMMRRAMRVDDGVTEI